MATRGAFLPRFSFSVPFPPSNTSHEAHFQWNRASVDAEIVSSVENEAVMGDRREKLTDLDCGGLMSGFLGNGRGDEDREAHHYGQRGGVEVEMRGGREKEGGRREEEASANREERNSDFPAAESMLRGGRVPISLEDLKRKKKEEEMAQSKPMYASKAERRERALAERKAAVDALKANSAARSTGESHHAQPYQSFQSHTTSSSRQGTHQQAGENSQHYSSQHVPFMDAKEVEKIRQEKLGVVTLHQRKAVQGASQRVLTKVTHWDDSEDTSKDSYESMWHHQSTSIRHGFGRSHVGGKMDLDDEEEGEEEVKRNGSSVSHHNGGGGGHHHHNQGHHHQNQGNGRTSQQHSSQVSSNSQHSLNGQSSSSSGASSAPSFSWSKKSLSDMTLRDWRIMREDFEISVKGRGEIPNPLRQWSESPLPEWALRAIHDAGYTSPTAIQRQAIPIGLEGRDLIGLAETGSGKTAAFLLPLLVHIVNLKTELVKKKQENTMVSSNANSSQNGSRMDDDENEDDLRGPYATVLAPTRELAMQIKAEADKFSQYADCRTVLLIGGEDESRQISALRQGADIIVATPGRLVQLLKDAWISLSQCRYVVLDEGDRMIDMGFEDQLLFILDSMPGSEAPADLNSKSPFGGGGGRNHHQSSTSSLSNKASSHHQGGSSRHGNSSSSASTQQTPSHRSSERTTILFSATMPPPIEKIANRYLRNPVTIYVGDVGKAVERIRQNVEFYKSDAEKRNRLSSLLRFGPKPPVIIFLNHKASCDAIGKMIEKLGFRVSVLHSGKSQEGRESAISQFKLAQTDVLVATNVAGRGLDVKGVTHVINYDLPDNIQEYTHRIGRTGRAGLDGTATSFLSPSDDKILAPLKSLLQKTNQKVPKELSDMLAHSSLRPVF